MIVLICVLVGVLIILYFWERRHLYAASRQYPGRFTLPLIGNAYIFTGHDKYILSRTVGYIKYFKGRDPIKFWFGPKLIVIFRDPNHVEKILLSQNFSHKMELYDMIKNLLGEGLVTASGSNYKMHKRIIAPLINLNFTKSCSDIFQECFNSCMDDLEAYCGKGTFDILHIIHNNAAKMISRIIFGEAIDLKADHQFIDASIEGYELIFHRLCRPWVHSNFIYKFTSTARKERKFKRILDNFLKQVVANNYKRYDMGRAEVDSMKPITYSLIEHLKQNPTSIGRQDLIDHILTLYLASEDTISTIIASLCLFFGMYPEYQHKAAEEVRDHLGPIPRKVTLEDLNELPYLDMCVKEALRIMPIAPLLFRKCLQNFDIGNWKVPSGSGILIPVHYLHRIREYWENPDHFHPDHFLPEAVKQRPVYAYLPFSAGTRGCIGKIFANSSIRLFMATFLQRYELEADGKLPDVNIRMDISARIIEGYNVRIKFRQCK